MNFSLKVSYGVTAGICRMYSDINPLGKITDGKDSLEFSFDHVRCENCAGALAARSNMILKSFEKSPLGAGLLAGLIIAAGFQPGVLQVLSGGGLTGKLLAEYGVPAPSQSIS